MKRRNFLKGLASIPLIGLPVKLLAEPDVFQEIADAAIPFGGTESRIEDPFEQFNYIGSRVWFDGESMNREWLSARDVYKTDFGDITLSRKL